MPCSLCHEIGHNKKTCPGTNVTVPEVPPVVCVICSEEKDIYKKGRCLECHKARKAAKKAKKAENTIHTPGEEEETKSVESAGSDNKQPWSEVVKKGRPAKTEGSIDSNESTGYKKSTRGNDIYYLLDGRAPKKNTPYFHALQELYRLYPERFSIGGAGHRSKSEEVAHIVITMKTPVHKRQPNGALEYVFDAYGNYHATYRLNAETGKTDWIALEGIMPTASGQMTKVILAEYV